MGELRCAQRRRLSHRASVTAEAGSACHQVCTSRVSFSFSNVQVSCWKCVPTWHRLRGHKIKQEEEENIKSPNFLITSLFSPSFPISPHPTPHLPLTTINLTNLDTVLTLCFLGVSPGLAFVCHLRIQAAWAVHGCPPQPGWGHLACLTTLKYAIQNRKQFLCSEQLPLAWISQTGFMGEGRGKGRGGRRAQRVYEINTS